MASADARTSSAVRPRSVGELFAAAQAGERAALARVLSLVERGGPAAREIGRLSHAAGGEASTVGLTGAPGAGKSTLTSALVAEMRRSDLEVAVLAIDPSSPYSGGAILGDRVRMQEHATDDGVFIRSMATRGHLGGLSLAAPAAIRALQACGTPWIVVETVGVGQVEVEIAGAADTTVVVVNPGWGDSVQASKAGLIEIADVFVINKADRPGAAEARRDLETVLELHDAPAGSWRPPIVSTVATSGAGAGELWDAVQRHRAHLVSSGELERRRAARLADELHRIVARRLEERARELTGGDRWDALRARVADGRVDPWSAADEMLGRLDG